MFAVPLVLRSLVILLALFGCTVAAAAAEPRCVVPRSPVCEPAKTDPLEGNLAFPALDGEDFLLQSRDVADTLQALQPGAWLSTVSALHYHVSIYYMFCVSQTQHALVAEALRTFRWRAFDVVFDRLCCENDTSSLYVEICLSDESQATVARFARRLLSHLVDKGAAVPLEHLHLQPPYHCTLGQTTPDYDTALLADARVALAPTRVRLDEFYFGTTVYPASDVSRAAGAGLALLALVAAGPLVLLVAGCCWRRRCCQTCVTGAGTPTEAPRRTRSP